MAVATDRNYFGADLSGLYRCPALDFFN